MSDNQNTVGITIGKNSLYGWETVRVTRSVEVFPSAFELELTERFPDQVGQIVINPGDPCKVTFGADTVLNGYVEDYSPSYDARGHTVRISGRSKCMDLIDCSAGTAPYQTNNTTLVNLAKNLCAPYGITVSAPDGDSSVIPIHNITLTESIIQTLDLIAEWANFILHDDTNGNLVIAKVGDTNAASGFAEGSNVQAVAASYSTRNRYTEIDAVFLSTGFLLDAPPAVGSPGPIIPFVPGAQAKDTSFPLRADGQPRFRRLLIVSDQTQNSPQLAAQRAQWDMARRIGRSQSVRVTCDSWRDKAGMLWSPNTLAPLDLPTAKLTGTTWLIATVTFLRNENGTTADVLLMPKSAFVPEPLNLLPFDAAIARDLPGGGSSGFGPVPR